MHPPPTLIHLSKTRRHQNFCSQVTTLPCCSSSPSDARMEVWKKFSVKSSRVNCAKEKASRVSEDYRRGHSRDLLNCSSEDRVPLSFSSKEMLTISLKVKKLLIILI